LAPAKTKPTPQEKRARLGDVGRIGICSGNAIDRLDEKVTAANIEAAAYCEQALAAIVGNSQRPGRSRV
jgi:hypothetical protein